MNLVIVNCTYDTFTPGHSGAICTWIHEVCREAETDGVRPLVISRTSGHPSYERPRTIMIDYPHLPANRLMSKLLGLQKHLARWVRPRQGAWARRVADAIFRERAQNGPVILHNDMELAVTLRRKFPGARIVHLAHNNNPTTERFRRRFGRSVDVALGVSDFCSQWNERYCGLPAGRINTLYNGVELDAFRPRQDAFSAAPIVNYVGKLDHQKGPDILLKALLRLAERTKKFSVQMVGRRFYDRDETDAYVDQLEQQAGLLRDRGITCRFTGWIGRDHLPEVLGAAHIHVTPSRWDEPFGLTTLEAMACGMAVIGSRTGGTAEVIGDAGFLFDREDDAHLAQLLERFVANPPLRIEYGRKARARAEMFSWRRTWRQLRDVVTNAPTTPDRSNVRTVGTEECAA